MIPSLPWQFFVASSLGPILLAAAPQEPRPGAGIEQTVDEAVRWQGMVPDNTVVDFQDEMLQVMHRALEGAGPGTAAEKALLDWQAMLLKKFDAFVQPIDAKANPREQAYTMLNAFVGAGLMGAAGCVVGGGGIGAAAGIAITAGSEGLGAGFGVAAFAAGTGAGIAAGGATLGGTVLGAMYLAMEIEKRYPYDQYAVQTRDLEGGSGTAPGYDDPEEWIAADLFAELSRSGAGSGGAAAVPAADAVTTRDLASTSGGSTSRSVRYAGVQESLFVHLVADIVSPQIDSLARHFDQTPGLSAAQRKQLADLGKPLQRGFQQLSYVRANRRIAPTAPPAMPLSTWQSAVTRTLGGDTAALQGVLLDSLAIGRTSLQVDSGKVTWTTPKALRTAGANSAYTAQIATSPARVKTDLGTVSAAIKPGSFKVTLGSVEVAGDRLRVGFAVPRNSTLGTFAVSGQPAVGPSLQHTVAPKLAADLTGHVLFRVAGTGLVVDRVSVGAMQLGLALPNFGPLEGLKKDFERELLARASALLGSGFGWGSLFDGLKASMAQNILTSLNGMADQLKLGQIQSLRGLAIRNGKLEATVDATTWRGLPVPDQRLAQRAVGAFR